jgi:hypothetical protein
LEIPDDDRYQLVVDQQVNEQYLLLLLFVPLQHNKSPKNSTEKNRMINLISYSNILYRRYILCTNSTENFHCKWRFTLHKIIRE